MALRLKPLTRGLPALNGQGGGYERRRPYLRALIRVLSPWFRATVKEEEPLTGGPFVFICNHGNMYGPVAAEIRLPYPHRTWSISVLMNNEDAAQYLYDFTFSPVRWLPRFMKRPLSRFAAWLSCRVFTDMGCIAVYRDQPVKLRQTFRESFNALKAGQNLLLFPENPNDPSLDAAGYVKGGLLPFHAGFAMLGALYHQRTGEALSFVPLFIDQENKVLSIGRPILYDARQADPEKALTDTLREAMIALAKEGAS